jgi:hypothetical protein
VAIPPAVVASKCFLGALSSLARTNNGANVTQEPFVIISSFFFLVSVFVVLPCFPPF